MNYSARAHAHKLAQILARPTCPVRHRMISHPPPCRRCTSFTRVILLKLFQMIVSAFMRVWCVRVRVYVCLCVSMLVCIYLFARTDTCTCTRVECKQAHTNPWRVVCLSSNCDFQFWGNINNNGNYRHRPHPFQWWHFRNKSLRRINTQKSTAAATATAPRVRCTHVITCYTDTPQNGSALRFEYVFFFFPKRLETLLDAVLSCTLRT